MASPFTILLGLKMLKQTKSQGLVALHQQSLNLLYSYAQAAADAARHDWQCPSQRNRVVELTRIIKADLAELKGRLESIKDKHAKRITSAVLNDPNHPVLLAAGGDYYNFIDDATNAITPHAGELMELLHAAAYPTQQSS